MESSRKLLASTLKQFVDVDKAAMERRAKTTAVQQAAQLTWFAPMNSGALTPTTIQEAGKMLTTRPFVTASAIKRATEERDARALSAFYAADAEIRIIDRANPPSRPRVLRGKPEIAMFWEDICGRTMTHTVEATAAEGDRLAFTEACTYPDGTRVLCIAMAELKDGSIAKQTVVQAWDE